jgi:hypothetical protein
MTTWYRTGTVSVENASTTVTGSLTAWLMAAKAGDAFVGPDDARYEITAVNSNTEIEIYPAYAGSTASGQAYAIERISTAWNSVSELSVTIAETAEAFQRGFAMVSTSSVEIGTGEKEFAVPAGLPILPGAMLLFASAANVDTHWILGRVTAYEETTITVDAVAWDGEGDTRADWNINIAGIQGETGPTGPAGPEWVDWQGAWSPGEFNEGQGVSHNGSTYRANTTTSQEPPHANWDLVAAKGADGTNGTNGVVLAIAPGDNIDVDATDPANPVVGTKPFLTLTEDDAPPTPAAGKVALYANADGLVYTKDDAGGERLLSSGMVVASSTTLTLDATHNGAAVVINASGGARTVNLPAAATAGNGYRVVVKKGDSSTNTVTVVGNGSETIDGATTRVLRLQHQSVALICDGTGWSILSEGALFESGSNGNGSYTRFANGMQICWLPEFAPSASADATWTYPAVFSVSPGIFSTLFGVSGTTMQSVKFNDKGTSTVDFVMTSASTGSSTITQITGTINVLAVGVWF